MKLAIKILTKAPMPTTRLRHIIAFHRLFLVTAILACLLRVVTMLGYRPGRIYWYDSYTYMQLALRLSPREELNPSGYPILLHLLLPFHRIEVVVGFQHFLGLMVGVLVYALLRHKGLPAWGATLASLPGLFDASFLRLEHAVLGDALFIFLVVAATVLLSWAPAPSNRACIAAGLLLAWATLTRTIGLPLLLLAVLYITARRIGWRPVVAITLASAIPLGLYATWYRTEYGRFTLVRGSGSALWARTMTFANCAEIKPPAEEAPLCPNGAKQEAAEGYFWASDSPLNSMPGGRKENDALAQSFAIRAILAQPADYVRTVATQVAFAFHWTPVRYPPRTTPAFGFAGDRMPDSVPDWASTALHRYAPTADGGDNAVEPYAGFLRWYQYPAYLRGPFLAVIFLLGALGLRNGRSFLSWATAAILLVAPVAALDFDHRYVLPAIPLACMAAGLGSLRDPRMSVPSSRRPARLLEGASR